MINMPELLDEHRWTGILCWMWGDLGGLPTVVATVVRPLWSDCLPWHSSWRMAPGGLESAGPRPGRV